MNHPPEPQCWQRFLGSYWGGDEAEISFEVGLVLYSDAGLSLVILHPFNGGPSHADVLRLCQEQVFPWLGQVMGENAEGFALGVLPTSTVSDLRYVPPKEEYVWDQDWATDLSLGLLVPFSVFPRISRPPTRSEPGHWEWTLSYRLAQVYLNRRGITAADLKSK